MEDLSKRLNELSEKANPGPYGVEGFPSGTTYLKLGDWVGHYAGEVKPGEYVSPFGGGRAQIINSNIPREWKEQNRKQWTAAFLAELANAWRDGRLEVKHRTNPESEASDG